MKTGCVRSWEFAGSKPSFSAASLASSDVFAADDVATFARLTETVSFATEAHAGERSTAASRAAPPRRPESVSGSLQRWPACGAEEEAEEESSWDDEWTGFIVDSLYFVGVRRKVSYRRCVPISSCELMRFASVFVYVNVHTKILYLSISGCEAGEPAKMQKNPDISADSGRVFGRGWRPSRGCRQIEGAPPTVIKKRVIFRKVPLTLDTQLNTK